MCIDFFDKIRHRCVCDMKQVLLYPSYVFFPIKMTFFIICIKQHTVYCLKMTCILYVMPVIVQISESRLLLKENGGMTHIYIFL